jgi:hypothetical protein
VRKGDLLEETAARLMLLVNGMDARRCKPSGAVAPSSSATRFRRSRHPGSTRNWRTFTTRQKRAREQWKGTKGQRHYLKNIRVGYVIFSKKVIAISALKRLHHHPCRHRLPTEPTPPKGERAKRALLDPPLKAASTFITLGSLIDGHSDRAHPIKERRRQGRPLLPPHIRYGLFGMRGMSFSRATTASLSGTSSA